MPFRYEEPSGYLVEIESRPGYWPEVYRGPDRELAVRRANFWDERVNVHFHDLGAEFRRLSWREQMDHKWNALADYIGRGAR